MTLSEWLAHLEKKSPAHIWELGLERVAIVAQRLAVTAFQCPVITVTGTNGKGSCVTFLEAIYHAAGYKTGSYSSPHLLKFNERIRLNQTPMDDTRLIQAFEKVEKNCGDISLTYFEFITLAALVIFQQTDLDILILEVGLGGRLDAVNIVDATVAIITTIALDHTQWLGDSREAIATEKAGIFRPHQLAVCGDPNPPPNLAEIAQQLEIAFYQANRDFHIQYHLNTWDWQNAQQTWENLPIPQLPLQNAATALMAITLLLPHLPVTPKAIKEGLKKAFLPARFQQIGRYIIDVAHNPHAATWLAQQLQAHPCQGQTLAVVGMLADKDIAGTLAAIQPQIDAWYVGELPSPRAAKATLLQQHLRSLGVKICYHYASIEAALQAALAQSKPQDRIIVFGSFYTAQEALIFLQKEHDLYG